MTGSLWGDLERMCGLIKHTPEAVDLAEVRALLRRCQSFARCVDETLSDASVTIPGDRLAHLMDDAIDFGAG